MGRLEDIKIKDVVDMCGIDYRRVGYGGEYGLVEDGVLTSGRRFNTVKNKAFDLSGKGRASGYPLQFYMEYQNRSKEEALQILKERFYMAYSNHNVRISFVDF